MSIRERVLLSVRNGKVYRRFISLLTRAAQDSLLSVGYRTGGARGRETTVDPVQYRSIGGTLRYRSIVDTYARYRYQVTLGIAILYKYRVSNRHYLVVIFFIS